VVAENGLGVYDSRTGNHIAAYEAGLTASETFTFSRDGSRFAMTYSDDSVWLWDGGMNNHIATLNARNVTHLQFSPDGSTLASASTDVIHLWDGKTGKHITSFIPGSRDYCAVTFSPDGSRLASISGASVWLWDTEMEAHHTGPKSRPLMVQSFKFSLDGSRLALVHNNNTVQIWSRQMIRPVMLDGHFECFRFSPDGARLALASSDKVVLLDAKTGNLISTLAGQFAYDSSTYNHPRSQRFIPLTFSLDGWQLAIACSGEVVHLWDVRKGNLTTSLGGHSKSVLSVAFSPDGSRLATASSDKTVRLWHVDSRNGSHIATLTGHLGAIIYVTFSPDGLRLVSVDGLGLVQLWDGLTGDHIASPKLHYQPGMLAFCLVAFSSDGSRLALWTSSEAKQKSMQLLDGRTGDHITDLQYSGSRMGLPNSLAFYQNDDRLAVSSSGEVVLWDITDMARLSVLCRKTAVDMFILHNHNRLFFLQRRGPALCSLTVLNLAHTNSFDTQVICWLPPDISPKSLTMHPDGSIAVVHCYDGRLLILDVSKFPML